MKNKVWLYLSALTVSAAVLAVACGGDDDAPGGSSGVTPGVDSGTSGNTTSGGTADTGAPDGGGCTFAGFVTNLVNTQTNGTAQPSVDLGETCSESTSQADFAPLFP